MGFTGLRSRGLGVQESERHPHQRSSTSVLAASGAALHNPRVAASWGTCNSSCLRYMGEQIR